MRKLLLILLAAFGFAGCASQPSRIAYLEPTLPLDQLDVPAPFDSPAPASKGDLLLFMMHGHGDDECVFSIDVVTPQELIVIWKEARIEKGLNPFQTYDQDDVFDASRLAMLRLDAGDYEMRAVVNGEEHSLAIKVIAGQHQSYCAYYSMLGTMLVDYKDMEAMFR